MPTYQVITSTNLLTADAKERVARAITRAHSEATGANNYFAQVIFTEKAADDYYLGGQRLKAQHLFVHATVRARSLDAKKSVDRQTGAGYLRSVSARPEVRLALYRGSSTATYGGIWTRFATAR